MPKRSEKESQSLMQSLVSLCEAGSCCDFDPDAAVRLFYPGE
jgi:hypothetical protein